MPNATSHLLTTNDVMTTFSVSRSTVERLRRAGHLHAVKLGGSVRYRAESVEAVIREGCPVPPARTS